MLTDEQIRNILGIHGALPLKDGSPDSIIEGREAVLILAIRAILTEHSAGAQALDPRDVLADTGHPEADRLIGRLTSVDPDFDDCTDAAVLIRQLVAEHRGPDGYATWKDAAVAERQKRVEAERSAGAQEPEAWHSIPDTPPVELMEGYGDQFSAPVLLHDGEKILPFVARWSFPEEGWVGAQFSDGPSPYDYEQLNAKRMRWMPLSAVAHCAQPMPQTDAARDVLRKLAVSVAGMQKDESKGDTVLRCGFNGALDSLRRAIDAEIERLDGAKGE